MVISVGLLLIMKEPIGGGVFFVIIFFDFSPL